MIVGTDLRPALKEMTGVGTYIYNLSRELVQTCPDTYFKFFTSSLRDRFNMKLPDTGNFKVYDKRIPVKVNDILLHRIGFPPLNMYMGKMDIFHSPSPVLPPVRKCAKIITIHDIYFLRSPDEVQQESRKVFARQIEKALRSADGVITVSEFTADEVAKEFGFERDKLYTVHHGVEHVETKEPDVKDHEFLKSIQNSTGGEKPEILLYVGTIEPRKNPAYLLDLFDKCCERKNNIKLVFAGGLGWNTGEFEEKLKRCKNKESVVITGYLDRVKLNLLYKAATALVMPSKYEGFGLPLIEAMYFDLPVICARNSAMPEVAGSAARYLDLRDSDSDAEKILEVLTDGDLRYRLIDGGQRRVKQFTWKKAAEKTHKLYESML